MANESLNEIKEKLSAFIETIDSVNPETTDMADIDEWLEILEQLEAKVKSIK
ncbi:SE1561 family protein [Macrococcus bovicus]|uniref:SE1561 family protein n=1 Tax=Macrococcus bovicus TaxID=69968 RepID=UPI00140C295B|nr:SE1561 family protein [Macrococcus bovicus]